MTQRAASAIPDPPWPPSPSTPRRARPSEPAAKSAAELIDARALAAELEKLARASAGNERELRAAVAQRLKAALNEGRAEAEQLLLKDRHGRRCAERLCRMEDEIIGLLFDFARKHLYPSQNPSEAERMAVVATGGYGRGLQAPGSDIDLLFMLPYKQTAWGESIAEAILYCLWDIGLKVGHATRSVDECIRQAKADMTIRTAILEARFLLGDKTLFDELMTRFDDEVVRNTAPEFVAAKLAEREERHRRAGQSRYLVEPNVKDGKGGLRDLHTLFWIAKYVYRVREPAELIERGVFDKQEYQLFRQLRGFPLVGALPHAFPHRPRRGAAVVRHPARDRGAARLHRASRPAGRRALHEALLPGRQGRRRSDRDPVRGARGQPRQERAGAEPRDGALAPGQARALVARATISSSTRTASRSPKPACSSAIRSI